MQRNAEPKKRHSVWLIIGDHTPFWRRGPWECNKDFQCRTQLVRLSIVPTPRKAGDIIYPNCKYSSFWLGPSIPGYIACKCICKFKIVSIWNFHCSVVRKSKTSGQETGNNSNTQQWELVGESCWVHGAIVCNPSKRQSCVLSTDMP